MKALAEIQRRARELAETLDEARQADAAFEARLIARIAENQIELAELEQQP